MDKKMVKVTITGEDTIWNNGEGGSRPAELIESDLVSWLEDEYGMKNVKVIVREKGFVEQIAEWVVAHAEKESGFLYVNPGWNINAHALLDRISEITGISKEQIKCWIDEAIEEAKL